MNVKPTNDNAAMVNHECYWIPVAEQEPPTGPKLLLMHEFYGVAVIGNYTKGSKWTHWAGLPKLRRPATSTAAPAS